ncbi:MAG: SH3 domain-containing protein [Treponema sp.]|uniref:SH3 domain-containing protein n=1 Tax=Treponema sp. TaxID=166 RepID=UPI003FA30F94
MEKNTTGSRAFYQRLLSQQGLLLSQGVLSCLLLNVASRYLFSGRLLWRRLLSGLFLCSLFLCKGLLCKRQRFPSARYCAALLLCCSAVLLYGQDAGSAIEVRLNADEFFAGQELDIDILIRHDAPSLRRNRDMPNCILEGQNSAVQLLQSSSIPEQDGLHLRSRYRFTQTGTCTLVPVLQWKRMRIELKPLHLTVHEPPLSEQTVFLWKLYTSDGLPAAEETVAEQGQPYLLCLTAAFYVPGYEAQYRGYLRRVAGSAENTGAALLAAPAGSAGGISTAASAGSVEHTASAVPAVSAGSAEHTPPVVPAGSSGRTSPAGAAALPLPAGVLRIDCPAAENAAVEPLDASQLPAAIIETEISRTGSGQSPILAAFRWIPLSIGMQALPQAAIFLDSGAKVVSQPRNLRVIPWRDSSSGDDMEKGMERTAHVNGAGQLPHAAFTEKLPEQLPNGSALSVQDEMRYAHRIASLRHRELTAVFPFAARYERKKLEAALGIVQPLPLYPAIYGVLAAVFTVLLLSGAVWLKFRNKKGGMIVALILALCCAGIAAGLFNRTMQPQAVCIALSNAASVRRIPEAAGSIVYRLALGESVWIVRQTALWCYVKTAGGITGWVPQDTLAVCGTAL